LIDWYIKRREGWEKIVVIIVEIGRYINRRDSIQRNLKHGGKKSKKKRKEKAKGKGERCWENKGK
jgi:hypothetical protein